MNQSYSPATAYAYSPSNQRVWKGNYTVNNFNWTLSSQEVYFYGVDGKKLGTYVVAANPVTILTTDLRAYFGSKEIAYATSSTGVTSSNLGPFIADRVGSGRSLYPYGEDKGTPGPNDEVKFATYTRDSATGLDYAMNRYYANSLGRFTSPDPSRTSEAAEDPGQWNRYTYVGGDPINFNDPEGLDRCTLDSDGNGNFHMTCTFDDPKDGGGGGGGDPGGGGRDDAGRLANVKEAHALAFIPSELRQAVENAVGRSGVDLLKKDCAALFGRVMLSPSRALEVQFEDGNIRAAPFLSNVPPEIGAQTNRSNGAIYIATNRYFFTGIYGGSSVLLSKNSVFNGESLFQMQETVIIHELLHLLGVVGDDNAGQKITLGDGEVVSGSAGVTAAVRHHCIH